MHISICKNMILCIIIWSYIAYLPDTLRSCWDIWLLSHRILYNLAFGLSEHISYSLNNIKSFKTGQVGAQGCRQKDLLDWEMRAAGNWFPDFQSPSRRPQPTDTVITPRSKMELLSWKMMTVKRPQSQWKQQNWQFERGWSLKLSSILTECNYLIC